MFKFLNEKKLHTQLSFVILKEKFLHPEMDFESILHSIHFQPKSKENIFSSVRLLNTKFIPKKPTKSGLKPNWIMGKIRKQALGNIPLNEIYELIEK